MFENRKKRKIHDSVVAFIKEQLPVGVVVFDDLDDDIGSSLSIATSFTGMTVGYDMPDDQTALNEADKGLLTTELIIPILESLDDDLHKRHVAIQEKLKQLR